MWMTLYHTKKSPSVCTINLETAAGKTVLAKKITNFSCYIQKVNFERQKQNVLSVGKY